MDIRRKIGLLLLSILALVCLGTLGFHYIEGWSWLDSLYTTIVTLGTVGYGDITPKDDIGKIFTIGFIIVGFSTVSFAAVELAAFVVEGHLQRLLRLRKVDNLIKKMEGHFIVCGAGNTGRHVINELVKNKMPFVVIDKDVKRLEAHNIHDHPHLTGDATDDAILRRAGIEKAKGLAATLDSDELNLFLVLTAKNLNHGIRAVAKVIHDASRQKLQRAGADAVVAPNMIGGLRMASEMIRPNVVSFLDVMLRSSAGYRFEEATVTAHSEAVGKSLEDLHLHKRFGLNPIAVREGGKDFLYNPSPRHHLKAGDTVVVIREPDHLARLRKYLAGKA